MAEHEHILKYIIAASRIDGLYYSAARSLGLHANEFILLYALSDNKQHSQRQIADEWQVPRTTVNSVTKKFSKLGYVSLLSTGHREKALVLTDAGAKLFDETLAPILAAEKDAYLKTLGSYNQEVLDSITAFTDKLEQNFKAFSKPKKQQKPAKLPSIKKVANKITHKTKKRDDSHN